MPRFLQHKCAACAAGGTLCPECEEEQAKMQMAATAGGSTPSHPRQIHAAAREGVRGADKPLPHLDKVQASFGRHDVSHARARTGGAAAKASARMGAEAYTVGSSVGFKEAPDAGLVAHEAAHVVQQRQGVSLKDGIGKPGDPYERQAEEVAAAVTQGRSAEAILDRSPDGARPSRGEGRGPAPVQHRLEINAARQFEAPPAASPGGGGSGKGGKAEGGGKEAPAEESAADAGGETEGAESEGALNEAVATEPGDAEGGGGGEAGGGAGGAGGGAGGGGEAAAEEACAGAGSLNAACYDEDIEEPEEEPEEEPPEPEATEAQEQMQSDSPEAEEGDDCPVEEAIAQQAPGPEAAMTSAGGAGAVSSAAEGAGAGGTPSEAEVPAPAAEGEAAAGGGGPGEGGATAAEAPSPIEAAIAGVEGQRTAAIAEFENASTGLDAIDPGVAALRSGARFAPQPGETKEDLIERTRAEARASDLFTRAAERMEEALDLARNTVPDRLGNLAESIKGAIAISIESQKQSISARIGSARAAAFAAAEGARGLVLSEHEGTLALIEDQSAAASSTLMTAHEESLAAVDALETATLDSVNAVYTQSRVDHEALGPTMAGRAVQRGQEYAAEYKKCRINRKDSFWSGYLTDRRAEAQVNAAHETAKGYDKSLKDAANKQAREAMKGRKKDRCGVIAAARSARSTIDGQFEQFQAAIESGRQQAITQADAARDQMVSAIEGALDSTLAQLVEQEHRQRQTVNDTGYLQQVAIEQAAHSAAASILQTVSQAVGTVQEALEQVQGTFASSPAPDAATLDGVLGQATSAVEGGLGRLVGQVEIGLGAMDERLNAVGAQALTALDGVTSANDEQASALCEKFAGQMGTLATGASSTFDQMRTGYTQQSESITTSGTTALGQAVTGFETTCATALTGIETTLSDSVGLLEKSLEKSVASLDCEATGIPKQAREAASHEAPAWKSVVKWVLIIAIIVVVALVVGPAVIGAVGAMAASLGAGAAAATIGTIVGGAIVGAATSATIQVLNNWETNQDLTTGVGKAAIMGAIGGAFGAGAGALIGKYVAGTAAQFALNVAGDAVLEIGTQIVTGEFSLEGLGMAVMMSAVTGGFGEVRGIKKIQARSMARGAKVVPGARAKAYAAKLTPPAGGEAAPSRPKTETAPPPRAAGAAETGAAPKTGEVTPAKAAPATSEPRPISGEAAPPGAPRPGEAPTTARAPEAPAARPPDAPARKGHPDRAEVEPGVVAKQITPDGHEVKVLKDGRIVTCSADCADIRMRYAEELKVNKELREKLDDIETEADPNVKSARAAELRAKLEAAQTAKATGETKIEPAAPKPEAEAEAPKTTTEEAAPTAPKPEAEAEAPKTTTEEAAPAAPKPEAEAEAPKPTTDEAAPPTRTADDVRAEIQRLKQKKASKAGLTKAEKKRLPALESELNEHYRPIPGETPEARQKRLFSRDPRESLADFNERLKGMEEEVLGGTAKGNQEDLLNDYLALRAQVEEKLALPEKLLTKAQEELKPALEEQSKLRDQRKALSDRRLKADSDRILAEKKLATAEARGKRGRELKAEAEKQLASAKERRAKLEEQLAEVDKRLADADRHVRAVAEEVKAREREARGVPPEHYEHLRQRSPSDAVRSEFASRPQVDEVYGTPVSGKLSPDHVVSMKEITQMEGFSKLTTKQQLEILNMRENFMGMDLRVNESKGAQTWKEWQGHPDFHPYPLPHNHPVRTKMIQEEGRLRALIQKRINQLAGL